MEWYYFLLLSQIQTPHCQEDKDGTSFKYKVHFQNQDIFLLTVKFNSTERSTQVEFSNPQDTEELLLVEEVETSAPECVQAASPSVWGSVWYLCPLCVCCVTSCSSSRVESLWTANTSQRKSGTLEAFWDLDCWWVCWNYRKDKAENGAEKWQEGVEEIHVKKFACIIAEQNFSGIFKIFFTVKAHSETWHSLFIALNVSAVLNICKLSSV